MFQDANLLVLSDVHLGEGLSASATDAMVEHLTIAERQLESFLLHYSRLRRDGRPWRLILNGDLVDFLAVSIFPGDEQVEAATLHADEHEFGYGRRPVVAKAKLVQVMTEHERVFRALAKFVLAGNSVHFTCGNHDVEFQWSAVQETFRDKTVEIWRGSLGEEPSPADEERLRSNIVFHPWFYYEEGLIWIEHGHQYDQCASFRYNLQPVSADGEHIANNVDGAGLRYVTNSNEDCDPHLLQEWNFVGFMRFIMGLGPVKLWRLGKGYYLFLVSLIHAWSRTANPRANRAHKQVHEQRMDLLSRRWRVALPKLQAVDALRASPAVCSLRQLLSILMVDRLLLNIGVVAFLIVFAVSLPWTWALAAGVSVFLASRVVAGRLARARQVNPERAIAEMPGRILACIDARYVVFGHTHEPVKERIGSDGWHINTGTWLPSAKPGLLRSFTHLRVLRRDNDVTAELCQWRDGESREFTPGWTPAESAIDTVPQTESVEDAAKVQAA